jgi:hypothetical protein
MLINRLNEWLTRMAGSGFLRDLVKRPEPGPDNQTARQQSGHDSGASRGQVDVRRCILLQREVAVRPRTGKRADEKDEGMPEIRVGVGTYVLCQLSYRPS